MSDIYVEARLIPFTWVKYGGDSLVNHHVIQLSMINVASLKSIRLHELDMFELYSSLEGHLDELSLIIIFFLDLKTSLDKSRLLAN